MINELHYLMEQAGDLALDYFAELQSLTVEEKSPRDLVTAADRAVEDFLIQHLKQLRPEVGFFGEERGLSGDQSRRWIIDPIDGTHSFVRGQYFWGISLALEEQGQITQGWVYAPALDDLFYAIKGEGAFLNERRIQVSGVAQLDQAMVGTGFACLRAGLKDNNLDRFNRIAQVTMGQRRFGSAALDLCLVAAGQLDVFWEQELNLYDVAAGALLVTEAGGHLLDFKGNPTLNPKEVLATNGRLDSQILPLL